MTDEAIFSDTSNRIKMQFKMLMLSILIKNISATAFEIALKVLKQLV